LNIRLNFSVLGMMHTFKLFSMLRFSLALLVLATLWAGCNRDREVVNVYSSRHHEMDKRLFEKFTKETGIRVNLVTMDNDDLPGRLQEEGESTIADVIISADASRLIMAKELDLLQKIDSETVYMTVPGHWRDREFFWTGLTRWVKLLVYHPGRVDLSGLCSYESLAGEQWKGRVLAGSSAIHYNQSLMASIIAAHGQEKAREWAGKMVENMAREPEYSNPEKIKFIAAGFGDVAIINSHYMGLLINSEDPGERELARQVRVYFPNQEDRGSHVNISGAAITAASVNKENAARLIEFLVSIEVQELFASENFEYPVVPEAAWPELFMEWGPYRSDTVSLRELSELREQAAMVFSKAGWR
jgi:iron(III) transport system substrate-binding protein